MDVMSLIQQALDASNKLRELSKKIEDAEFKMLLADLHSALADAKLESGDLKMKLALAQEQVHSLQQELKEKPQARPIYSSEGLYDFEGELGRFCTACWDVRQQKVRVSEVAADFHFAGRWKCPSCNSRYCPE